MQCNSTRYVEIQIPTLASRAKGAVCWDKRTSPLRRAEEECGRNNPLEAFCYAALPSAVLERREGIEHLGGWTGTDNRAEPAHGQCGDPKWDQPLPPRR